MYVLGVAIADQHSGERLAQRLVHHGFAPTPPQEVALGGGAESPPRSHWRRPRASRFSRRGPLGWRGCAPPSQPRPAVCLRISDEGLEKVVYGTHHAVDTAGDPAHAYPVSLELSLRAQRGNLFGVRTLLRERDRHVAALLAMTNWVRMRALALTHTHFARTVIASPPELSLRAQRGNLVGVRNTAAGTRSPRHYAPRDDKLGTRESAHLTRTLGG